MDGDINLTNFKLKAQALRLAGLVSIINSPFDSNFFLFKYFAGRITSSLRPTWDHFRDGSPSCCSSLDRSIDRYWTKKWIYIKFAQRKDVANICFLQSKSEANTLNATFATIYHTHECNYGRKCGIYHVCHRFALE